MKDLLLGTEEQRPGSRSGTTTHADVSLIDELEEAIRSGSGERRVETLRRVTDLFLGGAERFNEEQIGVFDDVLGHLIENIELRALREFSERISPVDTAPSEVVR